MGGLRGSEGKEGFQLACEHMEIQGRKVLLDATIKDLAPGEKAIIVYNPQESSRRESIQNTTITKALLEEVLHMAEINERKSRAEKLEQAKNKEEKKSIPALVKDPEVILVHAKRSMMDEYTQEWEVFKIKSDWTISEAIEVQLSPKSEDISYVIQKKFEKLMEKTHK